MGGDVSGMTRASPSHRRQQWRHADQVQHARQIIAEYAERHLGGNLRQRRTQEVRRAHAHLQRAERMLDGFSARAHGIRIIIESRLHGFDNMLVFPAFDPTLGTSRAF